MNLRPGKLNVTKWGRMRHLLLACLLLIALAPACWLLYHQFYGNTQTVDESLGAVVSFEPPVQSGVMEPGAQFTVRSCRVLDGYRFSLYIGPGKIIPAQLAVATKEEALPVVVDLLSKSSPPPPTITLLRQVEHNWIVQFRIFQDGKPVNLVEVLRKQDLLLE